MQGWVFGKWNFSEQRWSGAIFYRAQCRDRRRFPRIWFLNCKKSSWHLTPLSFLSWFGLFVYSKKRKASDPASQPKASQIKKVSILKRPHDTKHSRFLPDFVSSAPPPFITAEKEKHDTVKRGSSLFPSCPSQFWSRFRLWQQKSRIHFNILTAIVR